MIKKFLISLLLAVGIFMAPAHSQSASLMSLAAGDTIVTSASKDTVSKVISVTGGYNVMGIQVVTTKISGTVAGKAYLMGSMDGTNYVVSDSSAAFSDQTTNVAQFSKSPLPFTYYKVQVREAGSATSTQSNKVRVYYVLRKFQTL